MFTDIFGVKVESLETRKMPFLLRDEADLAAMGCVFWRLHVEVAVLQKSAFLFRFDLMDRK